MAAVVCAVFGSAAALAAAGSTAGGPATLRPVSGSGEIRFSGKGTYGVVVGTVTTKVIPSAIKPGEPVRFIVEQTWTDTDQMSACPYGAGAGSIPSQNLKYVEFGLVSIRPGHGEDLTVNAISTASPGDVTGRQGATYACGPPNHITWTTPYDVRAPGSATAHYAPGCYTVNFASPLGLAYNVMLEGTFATLSVGGVDCTGAVASASPTFTDTFSASGQTRPHAVDVPPRSTKAELTLRWTKPGDRFSVAGVLLVPKRKTSSVGQAAKLKITFFARTPTSLGVRITNLAPGKLTFQVVGQKISGRATVRTHVVLKA